MTDDHLPPTLLDGSTARRPPGSRPVREGTPPAQTLGDHQVQGLLGAGGMGDVHAALDPALGRVVAAKVVRGQAGAPDNARLLRKFELEARVTGQLEHPNIVPVYHLGRTDDGQPYFTMKRVAGRDLAALLDDAPPPLPRLLAIFTKVCEAVAFAHSKGVIHRDLKPANIMVGEFGEVLVMDWGLARELGRGEDTVAGSLQLDHSARGDTGDGALRTLDGDIVGTPAYMPPEQARGELDRLDERTDVYALGAILYQILTGAPPYLGHSAWEVLAAVTEGPPPPPSARAAVPRELEAIVVKAMAFDQDARYDTATALSDDILAYVDGRLVGAADYGLGQRALKWVARHRLVVALLAAALLTAAALVGARELERRRDHARALDEARAAIALARREVADAPAPRLPDGPDAREPSAEARRQMGQRLRALDHLASAWDELCALTGTTADRNRRLEVLVALTRLAIASRNYELADITTTRAADRGLPAERTQALRRAIDDARGARERRQRAEVDRLLDRARAGHLAGARRYRAALLRLVSIASPATVRLLQEELASLTERIIDAAVDALGPDGHDDLAEDARRWLAGGPSTPALDAALARLAASSRAHRRGQAVLAAAQADALYRPRGSADSSPEQRDDLRALQLIVETLGLSAAPEHAAGTPAALERYLWAECDPTRALLAAVALVEQARVDDDAAPALRRLTGLAGPQRARWPKHSRWFEQTRFAWRTRDLQRALFAIDGDADAEHLTSDAPRELLARGRRLAQADDIDGAKRAFGALADHPDADDALRATALGELAYMCLRQRQPAPALATYARAVELAPGDARLWFARGRALYSAGRAEAARAAIDRALRLEPRLPHALKMRAWLERQAGHSKQALADMNRAVALAGDDPALLHARSQLRIRLGDVAGGIRDAERAVDLAPEDAHVVGELGDALVRAGRHEDALLAYDRALRLSPRQYLLLHKRARLLHRMNRPAAALADADAAIAVWSENPTLRRARAEIRIQLKDHDGALADLDVALRHEPQRPDNHRLRGRALARAGQLDAAERAYDRAVDLDPRPASALHERGRLRAQRGNHAGAAADFIACLKLRPKAYLTWTELGRTRAALGQTDDARAAYDAAIRHAPKAERPRLAAERDRLR